MKDPNRLVNEDGSFKSEYNPKTIGYLEDLCEFVYYHDNLTINQKKEHILYIENLISKILDGSATEDGRPVMGIKCNYIPTWSTKLENQHGN